MGNLKGETIFVAKFSKFDQHNSEKAAFHTYYVFHIWKLRNKLLYTSI